ncbi:hypothetical protein C8F01DRAFT_1255802 [Mycena amicta]|nr:hypothetical protein C8F01DRAFT_1255802 [Mycena amicta]
MAPTSESLPTKKGSSSGRKKKSQSQLNAKTAASGPSRKKGESNIKGKHRALLEQHLEEYPRVAVTKNGKRKLQRKAGHWTAQHAKYWAAFPWRLPLDQEPPSDDNELALLAADPKTPEEEEAKAQIMEKTTKKYQWWIARREAATNTNTSVFSPWIECLRHQGGPPPCCIADYQFYLQHADHRLKILAELEKRHPVVTRDDRLKLLNRVAKEMLEAEPQTVKDTIRAEAAKEHAESLEEFQEGLEMTAEDMDEDDKAEARDKLSSITVPLLDELENHTDFALGLFCCRIKETENANAPWGIEFKSMYSHNPPDGPAYCDFSKADPEGYKEGSEDIFKICLEYALVKHIRCRPWLTKHEIGAHQLHEAGKPGPPLYSSLPSTAIATSGSSSAAASTSSVPSTSTPSPAVAPTDSSNAVPSTSTPMTAVAPTDSSNAVPSTSTAMTAAAATSTVTNSNSSETVPSTAVDGTDNGPENEGVVPMEGEEPASSAGEDIAAIVAKIYVDEAAETGQEPWRIRNPIVVDGEGLKAVEEALRTLGPEFLDILPHVEKPCYKKTGRLSDYPPALCLGDFWNPVGPLLRAWVCNPDLDSTRHGWSGTVQQGRPEKLAEHEELLKDPKRWLELRKKAKRGQASTWGGANATEGLEKKRKRAGDDDDDEGDYDDEEDTDSDGGAEKTSWKAEEGTKGEDDRDGGGLQGQGQADNAS